MKKKNNSKKRVIKTVKINTGGQDCTKIILHSPKTKVEVAGSARETYTFSSIFPNEDIMKRAFKILYSTE